MPLQTGARKSRWGAARSLSPFPLFGYDLSQYEVLFEDKLDLFATLIRSGRRDLGGPDPAAAEKPAGVSTGRWRAAAHLDRRRRQSGIVVRAARYELPLALAIIGGDPARFKPYVDLYHRAFAQLGKSALPIAVHSPGYIADTDEAAREEYWQGYKVMHDRIGAERGWPPMARGANSSGKPSVARSMSARRKRWRASIAATAKALGLVALRS